MSIAPLDYVQELYWTEEDGILTIVPRDDKRFNIKLSRAIEVLQRADEEDAFRSQFALLLQVLAQWLKVRSDIRDAYLTIRDGGLAFVVVRKVSEYDEEFEDELSSLDFKVANDVDLDLIDMDAMSLPSVSLDALSSFLDPNFTFTYAHGQGSGSHRSGKQES